MEVNAVMTQFQVNDGSSVRTASVLLPPGGGGRINLLVDTNGGTRGWIQPTYKSIPLIASNTDYENSLMRNGPYLMLEMKMNRDDCNVSDEQV